MSIPFTIDADPSFAWNAWGNMSYKSVADVAAEYEDNSFAAGATQCLINIVEPTPSTRYMTIEDDSVWDVINEQTLVKCFGYGKDTNAKKQGLNEHNCGLKHSLAYMDPDNSRWSIQIKQNGDVWELKAPYSHLMRLVKVDKYGGVINKQNGTFIKVPLDNTQFKTLYYQRSVKGDPNTEKLVERLRLYLSCFWMMNEKFIKREFVTYLNNKVVEPYDILRDKDVKFGKSSDDERESKIFQEMSLCDGSPKIGVEIIHLELGSGYRKDHPIFRRTPEYSGAFIFKHGRYIKGQIFPEIYGKSRDYHFAGHLVLVNLTGDSAGLPATHTTKNDFNNKDPKLERLYEFINETTPPTQSKVKDRELVKHENQLIDELASQKLTHNRRKKDRGEYESYTHCNLKLYDNEQLLQNKDQYDLVEFDKKESLVTIYEGKKGPVTVDDCRQLFFYYRNLKTYCPDFKGCAFELKFVVIDNQISKSTTDELYMLKQLEPGFDVDIEQFSDYGIH